MSFINLDDYKTEAPEDEPEKTCAYCGEQCEGIFCDEECKKADFND